MQPVSRQALKTYCDELELQITSLRETVVHQSNAKSKWRDRAEAKRIECKELRIELDELIEVFIDLMQASACEHENKLKIMERYLDD